MRFIPALLLVLTIDAFAADGDYPGWMGPDGTRSSDSGITLVDKLADARLLWTSEVELPQVYADPQKIADFPITHYCLPSVADGLVYYVYPDADQDAPVDEILLEKGKRGKNWNDATRARVERGCRQAGTDVVLAIDAETGKTVWQRRFDGKGQSLIYNGNYWAAPIIADGRVYVLGSYLWVWCLDAKTGETIWETELQESRAGWQAHFEAWLAGDYAETLKKLQDGTLSSYKEHYVLSGLNVGSPVLVAGVIVCNDAGHRARRGKGGGGTNSLIGIDAISGEQRWRLPGAVKNGPPPQRWVHEGRELVISATGDGFRCIDPTTGKQLWVAKAPTSKWGQYVIADDHLVCGTGVRKQHGAHAYRLSLTGMTEAWKLGVDYAGSYTTPAVYKGHVFARADTKDKKIKIYAAELETGKVVKEVLWAGGNTCNSPMIADNRLWFSWEDYLNVDPTSPDFMKQLAGDQRNPQLKRNGWASASVSQGRVFYRNGRRLLCADFRKR